MTVAPLGIRATVDFVFKLLFGSPERTRLTKHFLNAVLKQQLHILHVVIRNPILGKETDDDKLSILDILVKDDQGRIFLIEMQTSIPAGMAKRLAYYTACEYVGQLSEGMPYTGLYPTISICVLTKPMFAGVPELHLDFRFRDASGLVLTNDLQIHLIQLSSLRMKKESLRLATPIERWAYFLLDAENMTMDEVKELFPDEEFQEAAKVLDTVAKSPEQRRHYEARLKFLRDEEARLEGARMEGREEAFQAGERKGIEVGIEKGIEVGIEKGIEKGKLLGRATILHELLGVSTPTMEDLSSYDVATLSELVEQLQLQLRNRNQ